MGNVEPVSKKFKNFSFFRRELAEKKAKTITASLSTDCCSIGWCKYISNSKLFVQTGPKNTCCSLKNPETESFIPHNSPKKNSAAESLEYDGSWTLS